MVFTNVRNPRAHVGRKHAFEVTRVGKGATLGANSTVVCGVSIGQYAMVAAGAVITKDVPAYALVMGVPGFIYDWVCHCGERLCMGAERPERASCRHCHATLVADPASAGLRAA